MVLAEAFREEGGGMGLRWVVQDREVVVGLSVEVSFFS
jgi:hypothetical protein